VEPILTLTMNPAVDESTSVDFVTADRKLRCGPGVHEPGGGGINVARAVRKLGGEALAVHPLGGAPGDLLARLLQAEGVPQATVPVAGWTRENFNVLEKATGRQFRFCLPGPELAEAEWQACLETVRLHQPRGGFVVASGSLPPGVPADLYRRVARLAKQAGNTFVLDTSGEPLRISLEEGVDLLKPSLHEFREITGSLEVEETDLPALGERLIREGRCKILVLSLGAGGAFWMTAGQRGRLAAPSVPVRSSVGAGDSMVAGIVLSLSRGKPLAEAVRYGVAAGAAAVLNPGTELCRREDADRLCSQVVDAAAPAG
jgi:6-phosphofructokinase 2